MHHQQRNEEQLLRVAAPTLYDCLLKEIEAFHIHPYDIKASAINKNGGWEVILRYGDGFSHSTTHFFTEDAIHAPDQKGTVFFKQIAEDCQKVLIADYYKMMKP